jgi:membrane-bound serine protease (ClpP class)
MDPLAWSILLLSLGLLLLFLEVFVPTGGVLGFISVSAIVASIVLAFYHRGLEIGLGFLALAAVAVPSVLMLAFRWWPLTPMGKRLLLGVPDGKDVLPDSPQRRKLRELVGKVGVAKSMMLPSGAVLVDGMTVDAVSEGMPIEAGQRVKVTDVHGNRILVQPSDEEPGTRGSADLLSQPIESLGLEGFEEPLP